MSCQREKTSPIDEENSMGLGYITQRDTRGRPDATGITTIR